MMISLYNYGPLCRETPRFVNLRGKTTLKGWQIWMFPYTEGRNCFIIFLPVFYRKIGLFGGEQYGCFPAAQIYDFFLIVLFFLLCVFLVFLLVLGWYIYILQTKHNWSTGSLFLLCCFLFFTCFRLIYIYSSDKTQLKYWFSFIIVLFLVFDLF